MRTFTVALAVLLLGSGDAHAFDCGGVGLPSSLVICSDPELMRLADERQEAIKEAMVRLDAPQRKELMADQNGWVRSYSTACGAPPDQAPPSPVPDNIKECFMQAAQARIAYIRAMNCPEGRRRRLPRPLQPRLWRPRTLVPSRDGSDQVSTARRRCARSP